MWRVLLVLALAACCVRGADDAPLHDDPELGGHLGSLLMLGDELGIPRRDLVLPRRRQMALAMPDVSLSTPNPCYNWTNMTGNATGHPCNGTNTTQPPLPPMTTTTGVAPTTPVPNTTMVVNTTTAAATTTVAPVTTTPAPTPTYSCATALPSTSPDYALWLAWALEHCTFTATSTPPLTTTTSAPTTMATTTTAPTFACNVSYPVTSPFYTRWMAFYNASCRGTAAPTTTTAPPPPSTDPRSGIIAYFSNPSVLSYTPIITVGTTFDDATAFQRAAFSAGLSERLRNKYGLSYFTASDSARVVENSVCAVNRLSQYGSVAVPPKTCQSSTPCTATVPTCPSGITRCVCPSPLTWMPLSDSYKATLAPDAMVSRRSSSTTFVQLQFAFRMEYALSYYPATTAAVIANMKVILNATLTELKNTTFASTYQLDTSFLSVRYAYDYIETAEPAAPGSGSSANLAWVAVLVLIPIAVLGFGSVKFYDFVRRKRYGRSLSVKGREYLNESEVRVVTDGLGRGDWVDDMVKKPKRNIDVEMVGGGDAKEMEVFELTDHDDAR